MTSDLQKEEGRVVESDTELDVSRVDTVDVNNYHGLNAKTVLVYLSLNLIGFAHLLNIVASGAFTRDIAAVVGGSAEGVWLSQAIVILTVCLGPPISQAADFWGRKWFLVVTTAAGFVGGLIVARATSMGMAIAGEVICGVAYGSQPLLYAVISEILPRKYRPAAQGGINASLGAGGFVALLAGSAMIKNYNEGFRIFWYMLSGIWGVAALICALLYNPPPRPLQLSLTTKEKLARLDWVAYFLLATGTVLFVMALSWADNPYPWVSAQVLAPLLVGAALIVGLIVHQTIFKKDGLVHHDLFKGDRNFAIALLVIFVDGMAFFAANNYFAFEVSIMFETDPIRIGLRFSIVFFASVLSSLVIAVFSTATNHVRTPIIFSFGLFVIFFALMAAVNADSSTGVWVYPAILGWGLGFSLTCLVTIAQLSTPPALIAITTGLLIAIRSLGASVGLAIYTSIFNSSFSSHIGGNIAAAVLPLGISPSVLGAVISALAANDQKALFAVPGMTPQIAGAGFHALQDTFLGAFKNVWIAAAALSAVATIASCFFVKPKTITMHVDAPLKED